jgi:hypothetical protein
MGRSTVTVYAGLHDTRWTIVVKASELADANAAAAVIEPDGVTFTVPLRAAAGPNTPVAYWCGWQMPSSVATQLGGQLRAKLGLTGAQVAVIPATGKAAYTPPINWRMLAFDGTFDTGWTPEEILAKIGLATLTSVA